MATSSASARQLGLVLLVQAVLARAGGGDELEVRLMLGDRLAVGPDEPRRGLATRLQADLSVLAGLLAGDVDRRAPLVLGIEDMDPRGCLGGQAVQLEAAVADRGLVIAAPEGVERLDAERREDEAVGDRLPVWPLDASLDRHAGPQCRGDLAGRVAGLDLVGDDGVGAIAQSRRVGSVE